MGNTGSTDDRQRAPGGAGGVRPPGAYPPQPYYPSVRAGCAASRPRPAPDARCNTALVFATTSGSPRRPAAFQRRLLRRLPGRSAVGLPAVRAGACACRCAPLRAAAVPRAGATRSRAPLTRARVARAAAAACARARADAAHQHHPQQRQPQEADAQSRPRSGGSRPSFPHSCRSAARAAPGGSPRLAFVSPRSPASSPSSSRSTPRRRATCRCFSWRAKSPARRAG